MSEGIQITIPGGHSSTMNLTVRPSFTRRPSKTLTTAMRARLRRPLDAPVEGLASGQASAGQALAGTHRLLLRPSQVLANEVSFRIPEEILPPPSILQVRQLRKASRVNGAQPSVTLLSRLSAPQALRSAKSPLSPPYAMPSRAVERTTTILRPFLN